MANLSPYVNFFGSLFPIMDKIDRGYMGDPQFKDMSSPKAQDMFKQYYQFLTEEVMELYDAYENSPDNLDAIIDEVADVLGFLTIMAVRSGFTKDIIDLDLAIKPFEGPTGKRVYPIINEGDQLRYMGNNSMVAMNQDAVRAILFKPLQTLGMTCNLLKNRPWKKEQYKVDMPKFQEKFALAYNEFIYAVIKLGYPLFTIKAGFERKKSTNEKRIANNY